MPNMDGTGPRGTGRQGRGMGPCGNGNSNGQNRGFRRGMGFRCLGVRRGAVDIQAANTSAIYEYDRENLIAEQQKLEKQLTWIQNMLKETKES